MKKAGLVFAVCAWCASAALAVDRFAAPEATGSGANADNPGDLEALVAAAGEGDVIHLAPGDYYLSDVLTIDRDFSVVGAGIDRSVVIPAASKRAFLINHANAVLTAVTVSGANCGAWNLPGSAIFIDVNGGLVTDVRVANSTQTNSQGGGVLAAKGPGRISHCIVDHNTVALNGHSETGGGIVLLTGPATVDNCLICDNDSKDNGGGLLIRSGAGATVRNCTIINNHAVYSGGGVSICDAGSSVSNTVVAFNTADNDTTAYAPNVVLASGVPATCFAHCAFSKATCGTESQFVVKSDFNEDFSPAAGSSLIDSGDSAVCEAGEVDVAGGVRVLGAAVDVGCYEFDPDKPSVSFTFSADELMRGETLTITPVVCSFDPEEASFAWTISNRLTAAVVTRTDKAAFSFEPGAGRFDVSLAVTVGGEPCCGKSASDCFFVGVPTVYVVPGANPGMAYPYDTWETAQTDIRAAIDSAMDGATIELSADEFPVSQTIALTRPLTLKGQGMHETVLRSTNKCRLFRINHAHAEVSDLTVCGANNGAWNDGGSAIQVGLNGGAVTRVRVTESVHPASASGVLSVLGPGRVSRCLIDHNSMTTTVHGDGSDGGALVLEGPAVVENCLIRDNTSNGNAGGLMIRKNAAATVRNCTIVNNHAVWMGGGLYVYDAASRVYNTVVAFNTSDYDTSDYAPNAVFGNGAAANVCLANCAFSGTACGADPQVISDMALEADCSPAAGTALIDNGDTSLCEDGEVDFAGRVRVSGGGVDIGCLERDADAPGVAFVLSPASLFVDETVMFTPAFENVGETAAATWTISNTVTHAVLRRDDKVAFVVSLPAGLYDVTLDVVDGAARATCSRAASLLVGPRDVFVTAGENPGAAYPYDTPETARPDLADAIAEAIDGTTLHLVSSEYAISSTILLTRPLTIRGSGMHETVLRSTNKCRLFLINHAHAEVSDLTVCGANNGAWNDGGSAIKVGLNGGAVTRVRVTESVHPAAASGVLSVLGPGRVSRCLIDHNQLTTTAHGTGEDGGALVLEGPAVVENCLIRDNTSNGNAGGLMIRKNAAATVRNCTIVNNHAVHTAGGLYVSDPNSRVYNTVVAFNTSDNDVSDYAPNVAFVNGASANVCLANCAFSGTACGTAARIVTVTALEESGVPAAGSPLVDAGDSSLCEDGEVDFAGQARISGTDVDIGCLERDADAPGVAFVLGADRAFVGESVTFTPMFENVGEEAAATWTISNAVTHAVLRRGDKVAFAVSLPAGVYDVTLDIADGSEKVVCSRTAALQVGPRNVYVVAGENPGAAYPYDTPETASTNLGETVAQVIDGTVVNLVSSEYQISKTIGVTRPLTVRGLGMDRTVLRSANKCRLFVINDPQAEVADLTVCGADNGNWNDPGSAISIGFKGGVLTRVRITDSAHPRTEGGGVLVVKGPGRVSRCVIDHNTIRGTAHAAGANGGAVVLIGPAAVDNCLIRDNVSEGNGGGILIKNDANATVRNCTIVSNHAVWTAGGLYVCDPNSRVYNTVVAFNTSDNDVSDYAPNVAFANVANVRASLESCAFSGTVCGTRAKEVTAADFPRAARGNYCPSPASVCRNNGTLSCWDDLTGVLDLIGVKRLVGKSIDIGCYEMRSSGFKGILR